MTPEKAAAFYEDDEGPHVVSGRSWYDNGGSLPLALSAARNGLGVPEQVRQGRDYIRKTYGPGAGG